MRLAALSLGLLALAGCYETVQRDVGPIDAPRGPCDPIGSLMVCADECGGANICRDLPGAYFRCASGLCFARDEPADPPLREHRDLWCSLPSDSSPRRTFPYRGDVACAATVFGRNLGHGIAEPDCDALERERGIACLWSDGTTRTRTPPSMHDTCPALPTPDAPAGILCGCARTASSAPAGMSPTPIASPTARSILARSSATTTSGTHCHDPRLFSTVAVRALLTSLPPSLPGTAARSDRHQEGVRRCRHRICRSGR